MFVCLFLLCLFFVCCAVFSNPYFFVGTACAVSYSPIHNTSRAHPLPCFCCGRCFSRTVAFANLFFSQVPTGPKAVTLIGHIDHGLDHLDPNMPLRDNVQDLCMVQIQPNNHVLDHAVFFAVPTRYHELDRMFRSGMYLPRKI